MSDWMAASSNASVPRDGLPFFVECTKRVRDGGGLSVGEAERMMESIVRGVISGECVEEYLVALAEKGESVDEIIGSAQALRAHSIPFAAPGNSIDNCGTGGDGAGTFNISTVAALVIASTGQPVVKHGNRSASGRVGSADLMEVLGVKVDLGPQDSLIAFRRFNFAFLFAPQYHPATRNVAPIRKRMGRPTIFNLLGPLCNPARPPYQLLGVPNRQTADKLAKAALKLGVRKAFVVTGKMGADELIPEGCNDVLVVEDGCVSRTAFTAADAGLDNCSLCDLQGGDARYNAAIAMSILRGASGPPRDAVIFNAGAALLCTNAVLSLKEGCTRCGEALGRGDTLKLLDELRGFSLERRVCDE